MMNQPLTYDEIKRDAPSVFTEEPSNKVSKKYTFIPTLQMVEDMSRQGWLPYKAEQRKSKADMLHTKHMLRFRNDGIAKINEVIPEIVMTNSHDCRNAFSLHAGLFRLVCSNGLVVADQTFGQIKIKHQWYDLDQVKEVTDEVVESIPGIVGKVSKFEDRKLTPEEKIIFAKKAILTRWKDGNSVLSMEDILNPWREEDRGNSLWIVLNVVQEKLIRGGLSYTLRNGRNQTSRQLTNIDRQVDVNKRLWELAEEYV